jgi:hypothetical protein
LKEIAVMNAIDMPGGKWSPYRLLIVAALIAIGLAVARPAHAGETGSTDEYAGVPMTNSVILDPFDPVPAIQFEHGCYDRCGRHCHDGCGEYRYCRHDCRWHGWTCAHDCYGARHCNDASCNLGWWRCDRECRDDAWRCDHDCTLQGWHCDHGCSVRDRCEHDCVGRPCNRDCGHLGDACADSCFGGLVQQYESDLQHSEDLNRRYDEQSHWYFEHVMDRHHHHDGDWHDGDWHDGDWHDGEGHDGDWHDGDGSGPPPDVNLEPMGPDSGYPPPVTGPYGPPPAQGPDSYAPPPPPAGPYGTSPDTYGPPPDNSYGQPYYGPAPMQGGAYGGPGGSPDQSGPPPAYGPPASYGPPPGAPAPAGPTPH